MLIQDRQKFGWFILGDAQPCLFKKRGQDKHYLQATLYEHSKHESTSGVQHIIQIPDMKEPARSLEKPVASNLGRIAQAGRKFVVFYA